MRRALVWARGATVRQWPNLVQLAGIAAAAKGLWGVAPWLGQTVGGVLLGAFGVALERGRGDA